MDREERGWLGWASESASSFASRLGILKQDDGDRQEVVREANEQGHLRPYNNSNAANSKRTTTWRRGRTTYRSSSNSSSSTYYRSSSKNIAQQTFEGKRTKLRSESNPAGNKHGDTVEGYARAAAAAGGDITTTTAAALASPSSSSSSSSTPKETSKKKAQMGGYGPMPTQLKGSGKSSSSSSRSSNSSLPGNLLAILECPVCMTIYKDKVIMCTNGHSVCAQCVDSLPDKRCPTCRVKLGNIRNRIVERMLETAALPCIYKDYGCNYLGTERANHEKKCMFRPIPCLLRRCYPSCKWEVSCYHDLIGTKPTTICCSSK